MIVSCTDFVDAAVPAVIVDTTVDFTWRVVMSNAPADAPAPIVMLEGIFTIRGLVCVSEISAPPAGAGSTRVTRPTVAVPPLIVVAPSVSDAMVTGDGEGSGGGDTETTVSGALIPAPETDANTRSEAVPKITKSEVTVKVALLLPPGTVTERARGPRRSRPTVPAP